MTLMPHVIICRDVIIIQYLLKTVAILQEDITFVLRANVNMLIASGLI